jgi:hypothetical protein
MIDAVSRNSMVETTHDGTRGSTRLEREFPEKD